MPSDHGTIRRWLTDIQHHIGMAQGFVAGIMVQEWRGCAEHSTKAILR
jgi:hypothetical protein